MLIKIVADQKKQVIAGLRAYVRAIYSQEKKTSVHSTYDDYCFFYPTNEKNYTHLVPLGTLADMFAGATVPAEELLSTGISRNGSVLGVGHYLNFFYGQRIAAQRYYFVDLDEASLAGYFPASLLLLGHSSAVAFEHKLADLVAEVYLRRNVTRHPDLKGIAPYMNALMSRPSVGFMSCNKESPFMTEALRRYILSVIGNNQVHAVVGDLSEPAVHKRLRKATETQPKIMLIYLSNIAEFLGVEDKRRLVSGLGRLPLHDQCVVIDSTIAQNRIFYYREMQTFPYYMIEDDPALPLKPYPFE